jgi:hypothetical protein
MEITYCSDMNGDMIRAGTRIRAWLETEEYTAVVTSFERYQGNVVRITATRDGDGVEIKTFSDAVVRLSR